MNNLAIYQHPSLYQETSRIKPFKRWVSINVPLWLLHRNDITPGAKLLYGRLLMFMNRKLYCYPSQNRLAEELGVSPRTIKRYVRELKEFKLIEVEQKGRNKPSNYYVLANDWENNLRKPSYEVP